MKSANCRLASAVTLGTGTGTGMAMAMGKKPPMKRGDPAATGATKAGHVAGHDEARGQGQDQGHGEHQGHDQNKGHDQPASRAPAAAGEAR